MEGVFFGCGLSVGWVMALWCLHFHVSMCPLLQVLVHGEMTEMSRLKSALEREYETAESPIKVFNPKNLETVTFHFRGEKMAKVRGREKGCGQGVREGEESFNPFLTGCVLCDMCTSK